MPPGAGEQQRAQQAPNTRSCGEFSQGSCWRAPSFPSDRTPRRREHPEPRFSSWLASNLSIAQRPFPTFTPPRQSQHHPSAPLPDPLHAKGFTAASGLPAGVSRSEITFPSQAPRLRVLAKRSKRGGRGTGTVLLPRRPQGRVKGSCLHTLYSGVTITHHRWQRSSCVKRQSYF